MPQAFQWLPGPARKEYAHPIYDGDTILCAVPVTNGYHYAVVNVICGEDHFALEVEGSEWGWSWGDVEWFVPIDKLKPAIAAPA